jgi:hypothetical protein
MIEPVQMPEDADPDESFTPTRIVQIDACKRRVPKRIKGRWPD